MTNESSNEYVGLFIDWDNLAISVAAEMGGATPDLRRVVQRAKTYGTVAVAKAYAEWQVTSEKLAVYRAGVEPVYAPTFRFEPEPAGRGKSLADPCMVADIVDSLHLLPQLSTYVLVTGDKDLLPVVRLAQLRGKRIVVIGPDLVANVLRDMADEFVSYRRLVEGDVARVELAAPSRSSRAPEQPQPETSISTRDRSQRYATHGREHHVVRGGGRRSAAPAVQVGGPMPQPIAEPSPVIPETSVQVSEPEPVLDIAEGIAPAAVTAPDLSFVYASVADLLRERAEEGKVRVRATNLKDGLMRRIEGFSERRYGFPKFKDLLAAAETDGIIRVRVVGPVHWVSLPGSEQEEIVGLVEEGEAVAESSAPVMAEEEVTEVIRFILDLQARSRWLTYTYLLTNLIAHYSALAPESVAESRARAVLTYLVDSKMLEVDAEPREVEVAGAKHRVRMCRLIEDSPAVAEQMSRAAAEAAASMAPAEGVSSEASASQGDSETQEAMAEAFPEAAVTEEPAESTRSEAEAQAETLWEGESSAAEVVEEPEATVVSSTKKRTAKTGARKRSEGTRRKSSRPSHDVQEEAHDDIEGAPDFSTEGLVSDGLQTRGEDEVAPSVTTASDEQTAQASDQGLTQAFSALVQVLRNGLDVNRARLGAAGLKMRLAKEVAGFDEKSYGFSRFKDFLLAAEDRGMVKVESSGQVTWVSLPEPSEENEEPVGVM